ncbi:hypothetical protein A6V39_00750 [Candidatus Mycoplasma haematobovis]|uniref:Uncharacterized protein n=1 Tax=Candidatus Mycoplasma haematobovis TaxID=432608 RepID=A0A1A9QFV5_9MOLU|nr:hypothetical protein [Candidatus Mycoplasma haematobovis]OAL10580.1 hypothetical protein A6V39_00750 [Candidatus Mycoplasma haematobovis]
MAITKATKLIVGLLATGGVSGGVAGSYYLLKPKSSEDSTQTTDGKQQDTVLPAKPDSEDQTKGDSGTPSRDTDSSRPEPGSSSSAPDPVVQPPSQPADAAGGGPSSSLGV